MSARRTKQSEEPGRRSEDCAFGDVSEETKGRVISLDYIFTSENGDKQRGLCLQLLYEASSVSGGLIGGAIHHHPSSGQCLPTIAIADALALFQATGAYLKTLVADVFEHAEDKEDTYRGKHEHLFPVNREEYKVSSTRINMMLPNTLRAALRLHHFTRTSTDPKLTIDVWFGALLWNMTTFNFRESKHAH